jgi:hypothetical protein
MENINFYDIDAIYNPTLLDMIWIKSRENIDCKNTYSGNTILGYGGLIKLTRRQRISLKRKKSYLLDLCEFYDFIWYVDLDNKKTYKCIPRYVGDVYNVDFKEIKIIEKYKSEITSDDIILTL